ncbi:uncharacterized protein HD556DRAFT_1535455 [Suillus plorans]|uniref:Uncharacterized protein n=1 Tax=Suillus plorans TaxID=116603 RepID=A0A9P7AXJ8_9AGAM|nr:uncharacterized protein HD556DRAFT_1535455 [Suillus plorans]KAG1796305.1 hypothetical protein HD556DRAFT_1535455 [Suillus plorans]
MIPAKSVLSRIQFPHLESAPFPFFKVSLPITPASLLNIFRLSSSFLEYALRSLLYLYCFLSLGCSCFQCDCWDSHSMWSSQHFMDW